jgi:hypothetical protein
MAGPEPSHDADCDFVVHGFGSASVALAASFFAGRRSCDIKNTRLSHRSDIEALYTRGIQDACDSHAVEMRA